jgi:hypothetical protein
MFPKVGDIVLIGPTYVRIVGVYISGEKGENTIGLQAFSPAPHFAMPKDFGPEMIVPERLVKLAGIYRRIEY